MNYCNHLSGLFSSCDMFHLQPVNVNPYDLIYYQRTTNDLIPIELYKNNISYFELQVRNNELERMYEIKLNIYKIDRILKDPVLLGQVKDSHSHSRFFGSRAPQRERRATRSAAARTVEEGDRGERRASCLRRVVARARVVFVFSCF